jgi:ADP-ribose pyrophosphatase
MDVLDAGLVEEPISSEEIFNGKIVHLFRDTVRLPNGKPATREVIRHVGAAAVVPLTDEGNVILVRQYRYPFAQVMLEIPAGKLDIGENPIDCARRELL